MKRGIQSFLGDDDNLGQTYTPKKRKKKGFMDWLFIIIIATTFFGSLGYLSYNYFLEMSSQNEIKDVLDEVETIEPSKKNNKTKESNKKPEVKNINGISDLNYENRKIKDPRYPAGYNPDKNGIDANLLRRINFTRLRAINKDATRWISIPGTNTNSPVMQERIVGQYKYLWRDFKGRRNDFGSFFTPAIPNNAKDPHMLIFGHRTFGTFGDVVFAKMPERYANKEVAKKYYYIYMYYPDHSERWKCFLAKDSVASDGIYRIPYVRGSSDYSRLITKIQKNCRFKFDLDVDSETSLLVLSTCNSATRENVRFYTVFVPDVSYNYEDRSLSLLK